MPTSVSVLVQVPDAADRHAEHGVVGAVEAYGPGLVVPVAEGVQVHVHGPADLRLAVKEVGGAHNQVCPAGGRTKAGIREG